MPIWVTIARHDKPNGIRCGQFVSFADTRDWTEGAQIDFDADGWALERRAYYTVKFSADDLEAIQRACQPISDEIQSRAVGIDEDELGRLLGVPDFVEQLRADESLPVFDATGISVAGILYPYETVEKPYAVEDTAVVSGGNVTVGSDLGNDYTTIKTFSDDIASALTDNIIATVATNVTETAGSALGPVWNGYYINLVGNSDGNPAACVTVTCNHSSRELDINRNGLDFRISNLRFVMAQNPANTVSTTIHSDHDGSITIDDCIFDGAGYANGCALYFPSATHNIKIIGCIFDNFGNRAVDFRSTTTVENCTVHNSASGIFIVGGTHEFTNVTSHDSASGDWTFISSPTVTCTKCATGDAGAIGATTETGTVSGITDAAFQSVNPADGATYLLPTEGGPLNGAGTDPTYATFYINDVEIVSGDVDIGAKGLTRAVASSTGTKNYGPYRNDTYRNDPYRSAAYR